MSTRRNGFSAIAALLSQQHCCLSGNHGFDGALIQRFRRESEIMRWKVSHRGHDPRHVDLIAILALLIIIIAACRFYSDSNSATPSHTAFIVPSQSVRW